MIRVPNTTPNAVSFTQTFLPTMAKEVASKQIAKAGALVGSARVELDNATFRLQKAEESLKATEVAYFEAVEKSAWNRDELRLAYNNALAGFREADKVIAKATETFKQANDYYASIDAFAKGKTPDAPKAEVAPEEDSSEMEDSSEVTKREFSSAKRETMAEAGKAMPDGSYPIANKEDLANAIQSFGRAKSPNAVKSHIMRRAQALNATDALQTDWVKKATAVVNLPADHTAEDVARHDADHDAWHKIHGDAPCTSEADCAKKRASYNDEAPTKKSAVVLIACPTCKGEDENEDCPTCMGAGTVEQDDSSEDSSMAPTAKSEAVVKSFKTADLLFPLSNPKNI